MAVGGGVSHCQADIFSGDVWASRDAADASVHTPPPVCSDPDQRLHYTFGKVSKLNECETRFRWTP